MINKIEKIFWLLEIVALAIMFFYYACGGWLNDLISNRPEYVITFSISLFCYFHIRKKDKLSIRNRRFIYTAIVTALSFKHITDIWVWYNANLERKYLPPMLFKDFVYATPSALPYLEAGTGLSIKLWALSIPLGITICMFYIFKTAKQFFYRR